MGALPGLGWAYQWGRAAVAAGAGDTWHGAGTRPDCRPVPGCTKPAGIGLDVPSLVFLYRQSLFAPFH